MERSAAPSKLLLFILFFLQLVLLPQLLEARTLGGAGYGYKSLLTTDGDDDQAVLLSPDLINMVVSDTDDAVGRPSKRTPPSPKPGPSPHWPLVGCGAQRPPAPLLIAAAPPRDHSGQQPVRYISWLQGRMMEVFRAFLQAN
ncbi:uncharacterized protein LOC106866164 [Brachypodium distachyon]|uniref:Uncharacterized protein n=1 Tax=Brachypodium distachyon TaxID=15368 RepID=A0A0Q3MLB6_BRADI|nr:uncharacterized protein LOC106866164 [Brachypodium distachyon]KQK05070.1 hypothetical protein BRADI_2g17795v3 [Brachypodium distachyon]|eukprot:XP_014754401.1 uncharacterized protein LOC106866164 [Brachypodium distachyon]